MPATTVFALLLEVGGDVAATASGSAMAGVVATTKSTAAAMPVTGARQKRKRFRKLARRIGCSMR